VQEKNLLNSELLHLKETIYNGSAREAFREAKALRSRLKKALPKNLLLSLTELIGALVFALIAATIIRTMWFELYEIPSGSMRPTFQEGDRLVASKTSFGLNIPLLPAHFFFEPSLVQNGQVVIFCVDNMAVHDPDTTYFLLFHGKRMLIKRLIGKPGDTLYFYGGKIWGYNEKGESLPSLGREHVPFITFEGRSHADKRGVSFEQSGETLAKLELSPWTGVKGSVFFDNKWVPETKDLSYGQFFGFDNYAFCKIVSDPVPVLQIAHFPYLTHPGPLSLNNNNVLLQPFVSTIPLDTSHLQRLQKALSTARFQVINGKASVYPRSSSSIVLLPGVPDGIYQIIKGVAQKVTWWDQAIDLPHDHPLYNIQLLKTLFNSGLDMQSFYSRNDLPLYPQRFAYFDDGALKIMDSVIFEKDDPLLKAFIEKERANTDQNYKPFLDQGIPDKERVMKFGLKVPEKMYYVLGDNYGMSADSRDFGFVPEDNLRGTPSFVFWPPGSRFGPPLFPAIPWVTFPHFVMFILVVIAGALWWRLCYRIPPCK
jgi:signal peptidase I